MNTGRAFAVVRWAMDEAPTVRTKKGAADQAAHAVLIALAGFADKDACARPSLGTLADRARLTEKATASALGKLTAAGLVEPAGSWGTTTVWRLCTGAVRSDEDAAEGERRREAARAAARLRQRSSRAARHTLGGCDVTPSEGVTGKDGHTFGGCESHPPTPDVTPSMALHPQVSMGVTAIELPKNCHISAPAALDAPDGALFDAPPAPPEKPTLDALFADFWAVYPRRDDKRKAQAAFAKAVNGYTTGSGKNRRRYPPTDPARIVEGAKRFAASREGEDRKFTALPATWLNQARWEDESLAAVADVTPLDGAPAGAMTEHQAREWLQQEWRIGRPQFVAQRTGIEFPQADPPPDVSSKDIPEWRRQRARDWITSVYDAAMAALTRKAAS